MMKKLLTVWLVLAFTAQAYAQEVPVVTDIPTEETEATPVPEEDTLPQLLSPPTGNEVLVPLGQGDTAPFPGVLLNVYAVAWLEAEPDAMQERAQAWVTRRFTEIRLVNAAEVQRLTLRLTSLEQEHLIALQARDQQIESLTRINNELRAGPMQWWEQVLWIGGALLLGAAVGFVAGVLAN